MAKGGWALVVDVIDPGDGTIKVSHTFWGLTKNEASTYRQEHIQSCEYFSAAVREGRTIEEWEKIDELPEAEADTIDLEPVDDEDEG